MNAGARPATDADAQYAYLGPRGTFSQAAFDALAALPGGPAGAGQPYPSVASALAAVRAGDVAGAVVPIENSVEGSVAATLDDLAIGDELVITAEMAIPVDFTLLVRPGTALAEVRRVATHPHAEAQCRAWLAEHLPAASVIPALSTAAAAAELAAEQPLFDAAIASAQAGKEYGLEAVASGIGDTSEATTRFVLVERAGSLREPTGADKTTVVLFMHEDRPGALLEILTEFGVRGVNLTRLESRPTKRALGDYYFSIDLEGHVLDARVGEALAGLRRICADVRFLGSYDRHDGHQTRVRPGTSNEDFVAAEAWVRQIRQDGPVSPDSTDSHSA